MQHLLATLLDEDDALEGSLLSEAIHWYDRAAEQGMTDDWLRAEVLVLRTKRKGDVYNPFDRWRKAARNGNRTASKNLIVVKGGDAVHGAEEEEGILGYIQYHAEDGFDLAQFYLGKCYDCSCLGLPQDYPLAFEWYLRAARQGHADAQCYVGIFYSFGTGVESNDHEAVAWYKRAARQGHAQAQCNLGYSYEIGRGPLTASMQEANRWYQRSAMGGFPQAQFNLAQSYRNAKGLSKDDTMAAKWYACAAHSGLAAAQHRLGLCYEYGWGIERNETVATSWYLAAAEQGHAEAQCCLANMYETGTGTIEDKQLAIKYYSLAAKQGNERAALRYLAIKQQR